MEAPPRGGIAAERLADVGRVGRRPWLDVQDANLQDVARLGTTDINGPGANMDAEPLASTTAKESRLHRTGTPAVDILALLIPVKDTLGPGIALDHTGRIVVGMMRQGFHRHDVAGIYLHERLERLAEIAPVNGFVGSR